MQGRIILLGGTVPSPFKINESILIIDGEKQHELIVHQENENFDFKNKVIGNKVAEWETGKNWYLACRLRSGCECPNCSSGKPRWKEAK